MQTCAAESLLGTVPLTHDLPPFGTPEQTTMAAPDLNPASSGGDLSYQLPTASLCAYQHDADVQRLPEIDRSTMRTLIERLRGSDAMLAADLWNVARFPAIEVDARSLAIEILAAARAPVFEPYVVQLILESLDSPDEEIRFAAAAAASDVSVSGKVAFTRPMRLLAADVYEAPDVRRAAAAFLRAQEARR